MPSFMKGDRIVYGVVMILAVDWSALPYNLVLCAACLAYYFFEVRNRPVPESAKELEASELVMEAPDAEEMASLNKEYRCWKWGAVIVFVVASAAFALGSLM